MTIDCELELPGDFDLENEHLRLLAEIDWTNFEIFPPDLRCDPPGLELSDYGIDEDQ